MNKMKTNKRERLCSFFDICQFKKEIWEEF